jgi:L-lactate dehydrogenase complex protein LldG
MNREAFLARVRRAAEAGRRFPVHVHTGFTPADGRADGLTGEGGPNLVQRYVKEVSAVGGRPVVVDGVESACDEIMKLLRQYEPRIALCWKHPTLDRIGLRALLGGQRIEIVDADTLALLSGDAGRSKILSADIGITGVTAAVAETGSLLMVHGSGNERTASLTPPVHIAVVPRSRIVADLFDVFGGSAALTAENLPSNATFISGPSKTGDIEMKLVTGVHGPGKFHIVVIDADDVP